MTGNIDLAGFFLLGVVGGFGHCVGMCSPFVLFVSRRYGAAGSRWRTVAAQAWYTGGRIATYAVIGAAAGSAGRVVEWTGALLGVQRAAAIVAGGVLVVWALSTLFEWGGGGRSCAGWFGRVIRMLNGRVPRHPLAIGLLLGLLPCGLLYSAVIAASTRGGAVAGAAGAIAFGIGTTPALFGVSLADQLLARHRVFLTRLSHVFLLAMGTWFIARGFAG